MIEYQDAAQLYQHAEDLRQQVQGSSPGGSAHHKLLSCYKRLLVHHLAYAMDKKVETDLWNHGFKDWINHLQKSNEKLLEWFLDFSFGFYSTLLQEIMIKNPTIQTEYIEQHIHVHLGDISRYKNQKEMAEDLYFKAIRDFPEFGQGYNQIALMSRNDLRSVYFYIRSISLKHPFPAGSSNLNKMYEKVCSSKKKDEVGFVLDFLKFHGSLHLGSSKKALGILKKLMDKATALISQEKSLSSIDLVRMTCVMIFHLNNYSKEDLKERRIRIMIMELITSFFNALLLPIYTIMIDKHLPSFITMPAIHMLLEWILTDLKILNEPAFVRRPQLWTSLAKLLTELKKLPDSDEIPSGCLPEEEEIKGFLPLEMSGSSRHIVRNDLLEIFPSRKVRFREICDEKIVPDLRKKKLLYLGQKLVKEGILGIKEDSGFESNVQAKGDHDGDPLDKLVDEFSDESEDEKEEFEPPKPPPVRSRNAAMSSILKQIESKSEKPKVSFNCPQSPDITAAAPTNNRFVGINGPPQLIRPRDGGGSISNGYQMPPLQRLDFSIPPPRLPPSGLGRIGPATSQQMPIPSHDPLPGFVGRPQQPVGSRVQGYSLFSGQGMWPSSGPPIPRPDNMAIANQQPQQHLLFQPGPSPLERLLREKNNFNRN